MAGTIIAAIPIAILLARLLERQLIHGLTAGEKTAGSKDEFVKRFEASDD